MGTEIDLARRLGISRNIVREAVSRLRTLGVVSSRRGKGLVVARSDPARLLRDSLAHYVTDRKRLAEVAELRYSLEMGAIDFAVTRATPEQVARLEQLGDEFARRASAGTCDEIAALDAVDGQFHLLILEASHNELLRDMHAVLCAYWDRSRSVIPDYTSYDAGLSWEHRAIAQAFKARDALQARVVLSNHLSRMVARARGVPDNAAWTDTPSQDSEAKPGPSPGNGGGY